MTELASPLKNTHSSPLPLGMRLLLGFFYVVTASIAMVLLGIAYIWSDSPNSTDAGILVLIFLVLLFMGYLNIKAICAVHRRGARALARCRATLVTLGCLLAVPFVGLCWLAFIFLSWPADLPLFLGWVGLPALATFLLLAWMYRYLTYSPVARAAFCAGEQMAGGQTGIHCNTLFVSVTPPGVLLFLVACLAGLLFRVYWLAEFFLFMHEYSSPERTFAHLTPLLLEDIAILLLVLVVLFACLQRPARALFLVQSALWLFLAYEVYWLLHLFLENGAEAFEEKGFVWASGYALSAGAFLLYFKTSALARAFFTTPPRQRRRAGKKFMEGAGPEVHATLPSPVHPHAPSLPSPAGRGEK